MSAQLPVLVVLHVPWERPHRIADAFAGRADLIECCVLAGDELPPVEAVAGAIFMGGPMNVDQTDAYPGLADERDWIAAACVVDLPLLGVCLGSQLIARALGAQVRPGAAPELGWLTVDVLDAGDPIVGPLAPAATVLHWHGDVFDLPPGATPLAKSAQTGCQAFRKGNAVGLLFHAEADRALVDIWLGEPAMAAEAVAVLGPDAARQLRTGADDHAPALTSASAAGFAAFAAAASRASGA